MRPTLLALCSFLLPVLVFAGGPDVGRRVSDSIADDLAHGRRKEIYPKVASTIRSTITEEQFIATVDAMTKAFGQIRGYSFKAALAGSKVTPSATFPIRKFWYSIVTSQHPNGY